MFWNLGGTYPSGFGVTDYLTFKPFIGGFLIAFLGWAANVNLCSIFILAFVDITATKAETVDSSHVSVQLTQGGVTSGPLSIK